MNSVSRQPNRDVVLGAYRAFTSGAVDEAMAAMHRDVEWVSPADRSGIHRGLKQVLQNVLVPATTWDALSVEPEQVREDGDTVVTTGRYRGVSRKSGTRFEVPFVHRFELRDGLVIRVEEAVVTAPEPSGVAA